MKNQESLVDIAYHLLPLINIKGIETPKKKDLPYEERIKLYEKEQDGLMAAIQKKAGQ